MFKTQTGFLKFEHESAKARLTLWDDKTATVSGVYSRERSKGYANAVLTEICNYADTHGLTLELEVQSYGPMSYQQPSNDDLCRWYESFLFEQIGVPYLPILMTRRPLINEPTA